MPIHISQLRLISCWRMSSSADVLVTEYSHPLSSPIVLLLIILAAGLCGLFFCYASEFGE